MTTSQAVSTILPPPGEPISRPRRQTAFSLVEIVLALGICSFAMIAIVGMIPVGLSTFHDAMSTTAQSRIVQHLASEILATDSNNIVDSTFYFNEQGTSTDQNASDLAYTVVVETNNVESPASLSEDSAATVLIRIARTHPGQSFEEVEAKFPAQVYSFPVIASNQTSKHQSEFK